MLQFGNLPGRSIFHGPARYSLSSLIMDVYLVNYRPGLDIVLNDNARVSDANAVVISHIPGICPGFFQFCSRHAVTSHD